MHLRYFWRRDTGRTERRDPSIVMSFAKIPYLGATVAAIEQIEQVIRSGEFGPGDQLPPERELAEMLGVSRPTVREALQALTLLGILDRRRGSGTYVSHVSEDSLAGTLGWLLSMAVRDKDALDVLDARATLESGLARLAAERMSDKALDTLASHLRELKKAESQEDILRIDMVMHAMVAEGAANPLLQVMLNSISRWEASTRIRTVLVPRVRSEVADDQEAIVAALTARDPVRAESTMRRHILRIRNEYSADLGRSAAGD